MRKILNRGRLVPGNLAAEKVLNLSTVIWHEINFLINVQIVFILDLELIRESDEVPEKLKNLNNCIFFYFFTRTYEPYLDFEV